MSLRTKTTDRPIFPAGKAGWMLVAMLLVAWQVSADPPPSAKYPVSTFPLEIREWNRAEQEGWTRRGAGAIFLPETAAITSAERRRGRGAEIAYPHSLSTPERFALSFRARFLKLGQEDDGTGDKSLLRLSLGARTPGGRFGIGLLFTKDRYKIDTQYKVFRTDTDWHSWRFEVDTLRRTVAMFRDGAYVCLHQAGSRQPDGVRIQAQGIESLPAQVEFSYIRIEPLSDAPAAPPRVSRRMWESAPGEWLLWRRDPQNTGLSPMKGRIRRPRAVWKHPVGSLPPQSVFLDLDGDKTKETLISHGGNLTALRLNGTTLWQIRTDNATIFGVYDLDGDGRQELVFSSGFPSLFRIADAQTGRLRYTCARYPMAGVAGARIARMNARMRGLQAIVWSPQHEIGFCLSFEQGIENARIAYEFNWRMTNFSPAVLLADMNRDGTLDVVVNTYDWTFVFDGGNGKPRMSLQWPSGRNYGLTVIQDVDADGYPDVVTLADFLREHIAVLKNEQGRSLRLLWDNFYEQNYPEDNKTLRLLAESVADFDGDGDMEIAASLFDGTSDSIWRTFLLDARTGRVKQEIPGRYLVGAGVAVPGKPPVLLLSQPDSRTELNLNRLSVWIVQNGQWQERQSLPEGTLLPAASFRDFPLNAWSTTLLNTTVFRPLSADRPERGLFLSRTDSAGAQSIEFMSANDSERLTSIWKCAAPGRVVSQNEALSGESARSRRGGQAEQTAGRSLDVAEILPGTGAPQIVVADTDGMLRIIGSHGENLSLIQTGTGFITMPVAGRLRPEEPPSLLYINADSDLVCLRADSAEETPRLRWTQPAIGFRPRMVSYLDSLGVPVIADIDGDREREILVARKPNLLIALNADGEVKKTWTLPALPTQWMVGEFDDDPLPDLFVSWPSGAFVDMESAILSGKAGKIVWRSRCGNGVPAIGDFNGDGRDDILLRDLFERRTLDAVTGRDIFPITMWAGYHVPVILPLQGAKHPPGVVWISGAYSMVAEGEIGRQSWWKPFRATGPQAVADVDNDGRYEIGGVTAGQLYNWPRFYAVNGPDKEFLCCDALTGRILWSYPLGTTASGVVAADVDGDGRAEFVLGTADGRLIALRGGRDESHRVLWEMTFPAAVGPPIVCDVNGSGVMTLVVGCADGYLYSIR